MVDQCKCLAKPCFQKGYSIWFRVIWRFHLISMVFADKPHPTNWRICKFTFLNYNVEISSTPVIWCLPSPYSHPTTTTTTTSYLKKCIPSHWKMMKRAIPSKNLFLEKESEYDVTFKEKPTRKICFFHLRLISHIYLAKFS